MSTWILAMIVAQLCFMMIVRNDNMVLLVLGLAWMGVAAVLYVHERRELAEYHGSFKYQQEHRPQPKFKSPVTSRKHT